MGLSPQSAAFFAPLSDQLAPGETLGWQPAWRALYSKAWSADHLRNFVDEAGEDWMCGTEVIGRICQSVDGVESALAHWTDWDDVVIKAAIESSGRGQIHARGGQLRSQQRGWLENVLARHGQVVVEPWLDKALDLSLHFDIDGDGQVHVAGWTRVSLPIRADSTAEPLSARWSPVWTMRPKSFSMATAAIRADCAAWASS